MRYMLYVLGLLLLPSALRAEQLPIVNLTPPGYAEGVAAYCVKHDNNKLAIICSATDPLNVSIVGGTVSVGTVTNQATAAATPPAYTAGPQNESQTLSGGLRVQLNFGSTDLALGQTTKAGSIPVTIASNQDALTVNLGTIGASATAANQALQLTQETTTATAAGTPADAAYGGSGNTTVVGALKGVYAAVSGAAPAGTNIIGKFGIDQTTPGTTNGVVTSPAAISYTNHASTIATGGASQSGLAANTARKTFLVQNPCSATESLYFRKDGSAATTDYNSFELSACGSYESPPGLITTAAINVNAATTGHQYYISEGQ